MGKISKTIALLLTLIIAMSCLTLLSSKPANAQTIPKPSIPEFTIKYVDRSYDIPPTYGIDPYTGKTIQTNDGEHVDNRTVEITIKNQPFTSFTDSSSGRDVNLFYNVRYKGHFGQQWTLVFGIRDEWAGQTYDAYGYPIQNSSSPYTTVIYSLPYNQVYAGQMDIQVEALEGYTNRTVISGNIPMVVVNYVFQGQESGWSNTQTLTIPSASPTPTVPEFNWLAILPLLFSVFAVAVVLSHRKVIYE